MVIWPSILSKPWLYLPSWTSWHWWIPRFLVNMSDRWGAGNGDPSFGFYKHCRIGITKHCRVWCEPTSENSGMKQPEIEVWSTEIWVCWKIIHKLGDWFANQTVRLVASMQKNGQQADHVFFTSGFDQQWGSWFNNTWEDWRTKRFRHVGLWKHRNGQPPSGPGYSS